MLKFLTAYKQTCASVAGVPAVTLPGTGTATTAIGTTSVSIGLPSSSVGHVTVTSGSAPAIIIQSTFTGGTSSTDSSLPTATTGVPGGIVKSGGKQAYSGKQGTLVAIGAVVGAALVL
jgi:hypothetical protein